MKDRIKLIRAEYEKRNNEKLTQAKFAKSINLSQNMIAQVEMGSRILSDRSISDICRIYSINEEWLRTGNGEMYKPRTDNEEIANFLNDAMESVPDDIRKKLILALCKLSEDDWREIDKLAKKLLDEK